MSCFTSFIAILKETEYNFSGSKELARYIETNLPDVKTFWFIGYPYQISPLSAYLPDRKFYSNSTQNYVTYYIFKRENKKTYIDADSVKYWIVQNDVNIQENPLLKKTYTTGYNFYSFKTGNEIYSVFHEL